MESGVFKGLIGNDISIDEYPRFRLIPAENMAPPVGEVQLGAIERMILATEVLNRRIFEMRFKIERWNNGPYLNFEQGEN